MKKLGVENLSIISSQTRRSFVNCNVRFPQRWATACLFLCVHTEINILLRFLVCLKSFSSRKAPSGKLESAIGTGHPECASQHLPKQRKHVVQQQHAKSLSIYPQQKNTPGDIKSQKNLCLKKGANTLVVCSLKVSRNDATLIHVTFVLSRAM